MEKKYKDEDQKIIGNLLLAPISSKVWEHQRLRQFSHVSCTQEKNKVKRGSLIQVKVKKKMIGLVKRDSKINFEELTSDRIKSEVIAIMSSQIEGI